MLTATKKPWKRQPRFPHLHPAITVFILARCWKDTTQLSFRLNDHQYVEGSGFTGGTKPQPRHEKWHGAAAVTANTGRRQHPAEISGTTLRLETRPRVMCCRRAADVAGFPYDRMDSAEAGGCTAGTRSRVRKAPVPLGSASPCKSRRWRPRRQHHSHQRMLPQNPVHRRLAPCLPPLIQSHFHTQGSLLMRCRTAPTRQRSRFRSHFQDTHAAFLMLYPVRALQLNHQYLLRRRHRRQKRSRRRYPHLHLLRHCRYPSAAAGRHCPAQPPHISRYGTNLAAAASLTIAAVAAAAAAAAVAAAGDARDRKGRTAWKQMHGLQPHPLHGHGTAPATGLATETSTGAIACHLHHHLLYRSRRAAAQFQPLPPPLRGSQARVAAE